MLGTFHCSMIILIDKINKLYTLSVLQWNYILNNMIEYVDQPFTIYFIMYSLNPRLLLKDFS
jgi:hypothetical protein